MASARRRRGGRDLKPADPEFGGRPGPGAISPRIPKRSSTVRRLFFLWLSVELAAGIIALAEIVFALPSIILLELGRATIDQALPLLALSGTLAVYLGKSALPLVADVARLARSTA